MEHISKQALQELLDRPVGEYVATLYIPMHTTSSPPHITENQIRLKNQCSEAADRAAAAGNHSLAKQLQTLQNQLHNDADFWKDQTPGLLICAASDTVKLYHLPVDTEEYIAVDTNFHVASILGLVDDEQEYFVLTVAQHNPVLYRGDSYGLTWSGVELPKSVEDAFNLDESYSKTENQGSATGSSMRTGWFNGRGGAKDPREDDRVRFFRAIDEKILNKVDKAPLILAGIDAETAEFKQLSKHDHILQTTISGNHTTDQMESLHANTMQIIRQELVEPAHQAVVEEYQRIEGANPERAASDKKSIAAATNQGRVDKLLVRLLRRTSDTVRDDMTSNLKITFPEPEVGKDLNDISLKVWQMSGSVINLPAQQMPHGAAMVARLRY